MTWSKDTILGSVDSTCKDNCIQYFKIHSISTSGVAMIKLGGHLQENNDHLDYRMFSLNMVIEYVVFVVISNYFWSEKCLLLKKFSNDHELG